MGEYVNSQTVKFNQSHVSCGVVEAHHLPQQSPAKAVFSMVNSLYHKAQPRPAAFMIFSDVVDSDNSRGRAIADFITKQLPHSPLVAIGPEVNPKTGNLIKLWVWTLNHDALRKWYQDELANRIDIE